MPSHGFGQSLNRVHLCIGFYLIEEFNFSIKPALAQNASTTTDRWDLNPNHYQEVTYAHHQIVNLKTNYRRKLPFRLMRLLSEFLKSLARLMSWHSSSYVSFLTKIIIRILHTVSPAPDTARNSAPRVLTRTHLLTVALISLITVFVCHQSWFGSTFLQSFLLSFANFNSPTGKHSLLFLVTHPSWTLFPVLHNCLAHPFPHASSYHPIHVSFPLPPLFLSVL